MASILHIDDDVEFGNLLCEYLNNEGFAADHIDTPQAGLAALQSKAYDLLILDVMMPTQSGLETLKIVRQHFDLPVLMLTAKGDDIDRIVGLELGADDYVPKPCMPREVVARIRAILKRANGQVSTNEVITLGPLSLDGAKRLVTINERAIKLTSAEFNLLELLLRHKGNVVSKEVLSEQGLNRPLVRYDRSVDVHISSLRSKLGDASGGQKIRLHTIRGQGYQLSEA